MENTSSFLRTSLKANLIQSFSTNRQSEVSELVLKPEPYAFTPNNENTNPISKLSLKKQLIELREDKSNHDLLFSRFNGLQHKLRILEEDRSKMKDQFETRQNESLKELNFLQKQLDELNSKNQEKQEEIAGIRENNDKMLAKLGLYEQQIKENTILKNQEEIKLGKEKIMLENSTTQKENCEQEYEIVLAKVAQSDEELLEMEHQLKILAKTQMEINIERDQLDLEIKKAEKEKSVLEFTAEKQAKFFRSKIEDKEVLENKLKSAQVFLEENINEVKNAKELLKNLQIEFANCDTKLAESEAAIEELEEKKVEMTKERNQKEVAVIEQVKQLKQLDVELVNKDADIKIKNEAFEKMMEFNENLINTLRVFEEENQEVVKMVGNVEEIQIAVQKFDELIVSSRDFLANI